MATEVETLLPSNPLLKQDEQENEKICQADTKEASELVTEEQRLKRANENNSEANESLNEECPAESGEQEKADKKEFIVAPPPKVNPWTKKMNTVSNVNGQTQHGKLFIYH